MDSEKKENNLKRVMSLTQVLRYPTQRIYTFGDTDFNYKIISSDKMGGSILRTGKLKCKTPAIVTPETFLETFRGFSKDAVDFAGKKYGDVISKIRILGYQFTHILENESRYSENVRNIGERIIAGGTDEQENDTALLVCPDDIWEIGLVKVMLEILRKSVPGNYEDLLERGYFLSENERMKNEIEILFAEAGADKQYVDELADRLREYNLFEEYEDRFFQLFK